MEGAACAWATGRGAEAGSGEFCARFAVVTTGDCVASCPPGTRKVNDDAPVMVRPAGDDEETAWLPFIFSLILLRMGLAYSGRANGAGRSDINWLKYSYFNVCQ